MGMLVSFLIVAIKMLDKAKKEKTKPKKKQREAGETAQRLIAHTALKRTQAPISSGS